MVLGKIANGYNNDCAYNRLSANVDDMKLVAICTALFKEVMVTNDADTTVDTQYPEDWEDNIIMHANYVSGSLDSGNYKYNCNNTKAILLKRRPLGASEWTVLYEKDIETSSDFIFNFWDNYAANNITYEYALVPILNSGAEGVPTTELELSTFDGCWIVGKEKMFKMFIDLKMDRSMNSPRAFATGLNKKYPTTIKTSSAKYVKGSVTAALMDFDCFGCSLDETNAWKYRNEFLEFLYDGSAKIIKSFDGRLNYLVEIEDGANESASEVWNLPTTSFNFVQIGSADSTRDLAKAGLIDVDSDYWVE